MEIVYVHGGTTIHELDGAIGQAGIGATITSWIIDQYGSPHRSPDGIHPDEHINLDAQWQQLRLKIYGPIPVKI